MLLSNAIYKRLPRNWPHLYSILEKVKIQKAKSDQWGRIEKTKKGSRKLFAMIVIPYPVVEHQKSVNFYAFNL